ncbi:kinesin-like protein KIF23 isoform X2 [Sitophilus oryzae]|uniref:Kinesin-like protein n=1 Tax=Sitophilus oryzae TaxID=7048 RepID=A0A6J2YHY8_SITOR|nr:kinesin-like protein KIF23 isoform X2 [Sitophilus oryzae]
MDSAKRTGSEKALSSHSDSEKKDSVHVYCRIRPIRQGNEPTNSIKLLSADTLSLTGIGSKVSRKETLYQFKHIFTAFSSQSEIFNHVAYPLLDDLLHGKNGLLFTYGVTGSGKTYTLTGEQNNPGIMPRCIDTIFNTIGDYQAPKCVIKSDRMNGFEIQSEEDALQDRLNSVRHDKFAKTQRKESEKISYLNDGTKIQNVNENNIYAVFISYVEIYNNSVFDLLDYSSGKTLQNKILREDSSKNMYVNGVLEVEVKNAQEAFELFMSGQNRKRMAATSLNSDSSRSHSIFNIRVVQLEQVILNSNGEPMIPNENRIKIGQLSLVDLAGSERTSRTNNTGMRLKEASSINNSLMSLRTCLEILRENQINKSKRLVPYRDSRLTFLFKHYFEGDGTVKMIVCINPCIEDLEENIQVLKFAEMTQDVKITKAEVKYTPIKRTICKNKENQTPGKPKSSSSYAILPDMPIVKLNLESVEQCQTAIDKIIKTLKLRQQKSKSLDKEIDEKHSIFRKRLVDFNQDIVLNKAELKSLKTMIHKERQKSRNLQLKMTDLESVCQDARSKSEEQDNVIFSLKNMLNEKDLKINQNLLDKEKTKQKLALANEKMTQELDAKLRRQREHLNAQLKAKDQKLRIVKEIIDSEMPPVEVHNPEPEFTPKSHESQTSQTPKSASNILQHRRNISSSARNRRSRSAGEVWLEHNVIKPCPLGTVMQPTMKKRKSVSKLDKASDVTNPKQNRYCLVAQEPDTDGEMETKLYKGDIVPTCGGGAQVIFNDVEKLRQESPTKEYD